MKVAVTISGQLRDYKINALNHIKHLIEPNNADVFVYACSKNTLHTCGNNLEQKYILTTAYDREEIIEDVKKIYGSNLKAVQVNENEELDESNFGTLGYFKKRMNNQMTNIRKGFMMAMKHSKDYDLIVRLRPDNSMLLNPFDFSSIEIREDYNYSTIYPSGHRDPWFFSFSTPETFDKYCSFIYQKDADEWGRDNNFVCPETALEKYLISSGIRLAYIPSICLPFYQYDKTKPVTDFPYRNVEEKLIDAEGSLVEQK